MKQAILTFAEKQEKWFNLPHTEQRNWNRWAE